MKACDLSHYSEDTNTVEIFSVFEDGRVGLVAILCLDYNFSAVPGFILTTSSYLVKGDE